MKRSILLAVMAMVSVFCNAQFKLTPTAGLMTEDGPYIIQRNASEEENYEVAKQAIMNTIQGAEIGEQEVENTFYVTSKFADFSKLPGTLFKLHWRIDYKLKVQVTEDKILIYFDELGSLVTTLKNQSYEYIPQSGKNSQWILNTKEIMYLFNSSGEVATGASKLVKFFETKANELVKTIENNIK